MPNGPRADQDVEIGMIAALRDPWEGGWPQRHDDVARSVDPTAAPSYDVPGNP